MTFLRRLLCLLCKPQIDQAFAAGVEAQRAAYIAGEVLRMECVKGMSYAEGQIAGRAEAWAAMADTIAERTGGQADYVEYTDLEMAKRRLLH